MIDFSTIRIGDKVRVVGMGAPGFAKLGDILHIIKVERNKVYARREDGKEAFFALTCGAERLEKIKEDNMNTVFMIKHTITPAFVGPYTNKDTAQLMLECLASKEEWEIVEQDLNLGKQQLEKGLKPYFVNLDEKGKSLLDPILAGELVFNNYKELHILEENNYTTGIVWASSQIRAIEKAIEYRTEHIFPPLKNQ